MMETVESLITSVAQKVLGTLTIEHNQDAAVEVSDSARLAGSWTQLSIKHDRHLKMLNVHFGPQLATLAAVFRRI